VDAAPLRQPLLSEEGEVLNAKSVKFRHFGHIIGAATLAALLSTSFACAQTAGTVEGPAESRRLAEPTLPRGPYQSALPLASTDIFERAHAAAPTSRPKGAPGVSDSSEPRALFPAFGTANSPYTTARVAVTTLGNSTSAANTPVTSYPYRATGKLYFKEPGGNFVCTASLVKKGVLITAAHCVTLFGSSKFYSNWSWCPANTNSGGGVYGCYTASSPRVPTTYFNGTDVCAQSGVVCNDDMATLLVQPKSGTYAGSVVGWYGYGWNGYSYVNASSLGGVFAAQITELGYPVALDSGYQMERTDAAGWYYSSGSLQNTQIGSAQTGGSSGGPWIVNFGTRPTVGSGASLGSSISQSVVGVTSYGSTTVGYNQQGASYFGQNSQYNGTYGSYGDGNIGLLMHDTCTAHPTYC
jgi:V8-like Glu-specific endopeptidase